MKRAVFSVAILCAFLVGDAHAISDEKIAAQALAMTPQQFHDSITIKDDALDTNAEIDTSKGFQVKRGLLKIVWNDNFLRAFVDKKTGIARIQLYEFVMYDGEWRHYNTVNYETPSGPRSEPLTTIAKNVVSCSGSRYGNGCKLIEHFAFSVDETLLRTIAAKYQPGAPIGWKFKFGAQRAEDWNSGMLPAEIVGFLQVLDEYRVRNGLPQPTGETSLTGRSVQKPTPTREEMNAELRKHAKEAIDRGDLKAAKDYMDMIKE